MANPKKTMRHASALKAKRQSLVRREKNFQIRNKVRTLTQRVLKDIRNNKLDSAKSNFKVAQAAWQKAAKQGIFHANAAARQISKMASGLARLAKP